MGATEAEAAAAAVASAPLPPSPPSFRRLLLTRRRSSCRRKRRSPSSSSSLSSSLSPRFSGGKLGLTAAGSGVTAAESPSTTSPGRISRCCPCCPCPCCCLGPSRTEPSLEPDPGPCLDPSRERAFLSAEACRLLLSTRPWMPELGEKRERERGGRGSGGSKKRVSRRRRRKKSERSSGEHVAPLLPPQPEVEFRSALAPRFRAPFQHLQSPPAADWIATHLALCCGTGSLPAASPPWSGWGGATSTAAAARTRQQESAETSPPPPQFPPELPCYRRGSAPPLPLLRSGTLLPARCYCRGPARSPRRGAPRLPSIGESAKKNKERDGERRLVGVFWTTTLFSFRVFKKKKKMEKLENLNPFFSLSPPRTPTRARKHTHNQLASPHRRRPPPPPREGAPPPRPPPPPPPPRPPPPPPPCCSNCCL